MNTTATYPTSADDLTDVIGTRVLTGTQMVWISRLSTHPLPMIASGFVTVAGQGPSDSNGAGKSSYIAAVSLLCGDEQWRWSGGAKAAAELLFTAEVAAQDQHSNANHGYVIGVFTDPAAATATELQHSAVTVWLRLNRTAPYIDLRWTQGLHLAAGASDAERTDAVEQAWNRLDKRGTSGDLHANRFNETMYGSNVRAVSFLSTSVRASDTPNLLAQPLNELTPERIFDAVAALTGLDRQLETERKYRTTQHQRTGRLAEVRADIEQRETEWRRIEAAIGKRDDARGELERTKALWRSQLARAIIDDHDRIGHLQDLINELNRQRTESTRTAAERKEALQTLTDDNAFALQCHTIAEDWERRQQRRTDLKTESRNLVKAVESHQGERRDLAETARQADGRSVAAAIGEIRAANEGVTAAKVEQGIAAAAKATAQDRLRAAEQGNSRGAAAMGRLRHAAIPAAPLLDVLHVDESGRERWEPRLAPFEEALVVAEADFDRAAALSEAGEILIAADPPTGNAGAAGLPASADPRFSLTRFLTALEARGDETDRFTDLPARVKVAGHYPAPITGRTARIRQARQELETASEQLEETDEKVTLAESHLALAERRKTGAEAAQRAGDLEAAIRQGRERNEVIAETLEAEQAEYERAKGEHEQMIVRRLQRQTQITDLEGEIDRLRNTLIENAERRGKYQDEIAAIDIEGLLKDLGTRDVRDAQIHLLSLGEEEQDLGLEDWTDLTLMSLEKALSACFPPETAIATLPQIVRDLAWNPADPRIHRRSLAAASIPDLTAGLASHLKANAEHDRYERQRIAHDRVEQDANLAAAQTGFSEATQAAEALRSSLATFIKATAKDVARHFDDLDRAYGGYGADIECPEPPTPSEPDKPWRWTLVPKWSRAEGRRPASYRLKGNTAQVAAKAIKLVCAAALASGQDRPLVLILDELGNNLGQQHRRDAVALFEAIGNDRNITVIGALQDEMERYAVEASGLFIKLCRSSDTQPYNDPPAIVGHDAQADRIHLLQTWLETGHLAAGRPGEADRPR
ncbi:chromosome segregation ATPase [Glycomyces sp. NPDC047010]|uniref:chromosome segregation ATPase n=1 Tax=Glycomyces sp. NPDC047010 TaxID=3155023 RepID=UPI0033ED7339